MSARAAFIAADPRPTMGEIVLGGAVALAAVLQTIAEPIAGVPAIGIAVAALLGLAVFGARSLPLPAAALTCVAIVLDAAGGYVPEDVIAVVVATIVVTYRVSCWAPVPAAVFVTVIVVATVVLVTPHDPTDILWETVLMVLPFAAGQAMRRHRRVLAALQAANLELERTREERADAAVATERMRVAREVHDVVAHSVSVMVVQAVAADTAIENDPAAAKRSLDAIERTGREALIELRGLLGVLRSDEQRDAAGQHAPQPGLAELDRLAARFREAGLDVEVRRDVHAFTVPPGVDLAAYRITQEALTNALKHGGAYPVSVDLRVHAGVIDLTITDRIERAGQRVPVPASRGMSGLGREVGGHGIEGMRERATAHGGSLTAGATPDGGYAVVARLPFEDDAP